MIGTPFELAHDDNNPLDLVEELAVSRGWKFIRNDDELMTVKLQGHKAVYEVSMEWQEEFNALLFSCVMPVAIPDANFEASLRALEEINANVWLGHFDLSSKGIYPTFRHTLLLRMIPAGIAVDIIADLAEIALAECNRFYSTFQLIQAGDVRLQDNLHAAIFETVGEA